MSSRKKDKIDVMVVHERSVSQPPSRRRTSSPVKSKKSTHHRSHSRAPSDSPSKTNGKRDFMRENKRNTKVRRDMFADYKVRFEERKALDAKKKEEQARLEEEWLAGLRPDSRGKPAFRFDMDDPEDDTPQIEPEPKDWKEKRKMVEERREKQKELDEKWLESLRPTFEGNNEWDFSTELNNENEEEINEKSERAEKKHKRIRRKKH